MVCRQSQAQKQPSIKIQTVLLYGLFLSLQALIITDLMLPVSAVPTVLLFIIITGQYKTPFIQSQEIPQPLQLLQDMG